MQLIEAVIGLNHLHNILFLLLAESGDVYAHGLIPLGAAQQLICGHVENTGHFYKNLEEQFFTVGHTLDGLDAISKGKAEGVDFDGDAMKCSYVARINELFYTVELIILDNDNGYGIVSLAVVLNTDTKYYKTETD